MGLQSEAVRRVEGTGWYQSTVFDASDILEMVGEGNISIEESEPYHDSYSGTKLYKITVVVEEV